MDYVPHSTTRNVPPPKKKRAFGGNFLFIVIIILGIVFSLVFERVFYRPGIVASPVDNIQDDINTENPTETLLPTNTPTPIPTNTPTPFYELTDVAQEKELAKERATSLVAESRAIEILMDISISADRKILETTQTAVAIEDEIAKRTATSTPIPPSATPDLVKTEYYYSMLDVSLEAAKNEADKKGNILGIAIILLTMFFIFVGFAILVIKNYYARLYDDNEFEENNHDNSQSENPLPGILQGITRGNFSQIKTMWRNQVNSNNRSNRAIEREMWGKEGGIYAKRVKLVIDFLEAKHHSPIVYSYSDFVEWVRLTLGSQSQNRNKL